MRKVLLAGAVIGLLGLVPVVARAQAGPSARLDDALIAQLDAAAPTDHVAVLVHGDTIDAAEDAVTAAGLTPVGSMQRIGVVVAAGTAAQIDAASREPGVRFLEANVHLGYDLQTATRATRVDEAYTAFTSSTSPIDGSGVSIAIIDSGIKGDHPMFQEDGASKVMRNMKLICRVCDPDLVELGQTNWLDVTDSTNDTDTISAGGHGTHVAGIAAGNEVTTTDGRELHGVAKGAKLIGLSVGEATLAPTFGMNWVLENHADPCGTGDSACPPIKVVSISISATGDTYDPETAAAKLQDALVADGVTVVWSAGNFGGDGSTPEVKGQKQSPTPGVITVANYYDGNIGTRDGGLDTSSSRGLAGEVSTYPDLSAPGTNITSACGLTLPICRTGLDAADPDYDTITGTSMAAPHVAGIVAMLAQANPALTPGAIEDILEDTAYKFAGGGAYEPDLPERNADDTTSFDKGHGLVDATAALARALAVPAPAPPAPCAGGGQVLVDPEGDARDVIVPTPLPSEPGLDIVATRVSHAAGVTTFVIDVHDLTEQYPTGSTGSYFDINFSYGGGGYYLTAEKGVQRERYLMGKFETTRTTLIPDLTGSFDPVTDTVTIELPSARLTAANLPTIEPGTVLSSFEVVSRRIMGVVVPNADTANGPCPFTA